MSKRLDAVDGEVYPLEGQRRDSWGRVRTLHTATEQNIAAILRQGKLGEGTKKGSIHGQPFQLALMNCYDNQRQLTKSRKTRGVQPTVIHGVSKTWGWANLMDPEQLSNHSWGARRIIPKAERGARGLYLASYIEQRHGSPNRPHGTAFKEATRSFL